MIITGKTILFGDNINTDAIIPGKYLTYLDPLELAKHAMEGIDPDFSMKASKGVIIIAGKNFGCGSSREQAPIALKHAGVECLVAESFARIFFRNSINIGLPILEGLKTTKHIKTDDCLEIFLEEGKIVNKTRNKIFYTLKTPTFILDILKNGGLIEHLKKQRRKKK